MTDHSPWRAGYAFKGRRPLKIPEQGFALQPIPEYSSLPDSYAKTSGEE
ncbi:MAG: hypothetical protein QM523_09060 [Candidatus Pacebacteria bacterium]|nr:hypothetical protein [Candidatus Paceibacterota bacterium]